MLTSMISTSMLTTQIIWMNDYMVFMYYGMFTCLILTFYELTDPLGFMYLLLHRHRDLTSAVASSSLSLCSVK